ncbi:hypothetical protein GKZ28_04100 [Clostridium chromiireducens]|uniref:Cadherin-like beta-sandwich-like domain-containing protein n=1 Tax=Clostridium chromiireducens TaxID=225345 RepID=A0A964RJQ5_9CLOT|nr:cadherin-like beta sandwich domain-containing protein [Clostridium chromiireducens]MVX62885.1 hypothetical protein [Clostridium chromiireducens]
MNKRIKRIIIATLALTVSSASLPMKYFNFIKSDIAYASSDDDDYKAIENSYLADLDVSEGTLNFTKKKTDYTVKIDSSDESIKITAVAKNTTDKIKIDNSYVTLDSNNKAEKTIELEKGRNLIKIKVETQDYGTRIYNLVVNRGSASNSNSSSSNDLDGVYLNNIDLSDGELSFSRNKLSYDVNVNSSVNEIRITAEPEDDTYEVKIDGVRVDSDESFRRSIKLNNGKNTILINLEDNEGNEQTYTLNIYKTTATNNSEVIDNTQDPIYLDDLVIEDGDIPIKFKPKVTSYAIDVKDSYDSIIIKAQPEHDDIVIINGEKCQKSYVRRVDLNEGKNVIEIQVNNNNSYDQSDDEYEERTYKLTIYRGISQGTSKDTESQENNSNIKINTWVNKNGKWQYNDSTGNPLRSTWYLDRKYSKYYYFQQDANMATGWISYNGKWYYLDNSGAMVTGWFKDMNGNWYYLNSSGDMAENTVINGYKINSNGIWIK